MLPHKLILLYCPYHTLVANAILVGLATTYGLDILLGLAMIFVASIPSLGLGMCC